jgi:hypothetical protein
VRGPFTPVEHAAQSMIAEHDITNAKRFIDLPSPSIAASFALRRVPTANAQAASSPA